MQFHFITVWHTINDNIIYADKTLTLRKFMYIMRASRASELENLCIFTFKGCYFFQYFVGTSETLSVQITYSSAYTYRQISKCRPIYTNKTPKSIGGQLPPPLLWRLISKGWVTGAGGERGGNREGRTLSR